MAPKRRTASAQARAAATTQQPKLSFSNRVTKPSTPAHETKKSSKRNADLVEEIADPDLKAEASPERDVEVQPEPSRAKLAIRDQATDALPDPLEPTAEPQTNEALLGGRGEQSELGATGGQTGTGWVADEESRARKVSEVQIKKYWRAKEEARLAPRVHQGELGLYEKVLREWDMSGEYGPCIGIARLKRWKRANLLGLDPPVEVLAVLLRQMDDGNVKGLRAYVDELMNSHGVAEP